MNTPSSFLYNVRILAGTLLLSFMLPVGASATTWYVDNAASGANKGTSWTDAWKSFSNIVWGSSGVKAGDTLYISGGSTAKTYTTSLIVGASGTASQPITIAVDEANTSHNGIVTFDFNSLGDEASASIYAIQCAQNYITISGNVKGARHIAINNLRNIKDNTATSGISAWGTTGVIVEYLSSTNCNNPVRITSSTAFEIRNCSLSQVRGDAAIAAAGSTGVFDTSKVHDNYIETLYNNVAPAGASWAYGGADGIQVGSGVSIYINTIVCNKSSVYTSSQHPDSVQAQGNYVKIYDNEFKNVGDSNIDFDCFANSTPHDVWIYNNVFWISTIIDPYPEFFRLYTSSKAVTSIANFKIWNNTFSGNNDWKSISFNAFNGNPTVSGCEIKNNIFNNCGNDTYKPVIEIGNSSNFTVTDWDTDANIYYNPIQPQYIMVKGTKYTLANWVSAYEPKGSVVQPTFANATAGDFKASSATAPQVGTGVILKDAFLDDRTTAPRMPSLLVTAPWDIGAYQYHGLTTVSPPANATVTITAN